MNEAARPDGEAPSNDEQEGQPPATIDGDDDDETNLLTGRPRTQWSRVIAFGLLPAVAMGITVGVGFLCWKDASARAGDAARMESAQVAKDSVAALLSYKPDTVDQDLGKAQDLLTGSFRDSYTQLIHDVIIPGAKQRHIAATATVPAVAPISATPAHAVALVLVDQTVTIGSDPPTATTSAVRVVLDKVGDRWLISQFDPV